MASACFLFSLVFGSNNKRKATNNSLVPTSLFEQIHCTIASAYSTLFQKY